MALTKATYSMILGAPINVLDHGASNDGTNATATTAAIRSAILKAQENQAQVFFPVGRYAINDTIILENIPVGFLGEQNPVWQSGSDLPSVTLEWVGGALPMFHCTYSNFQFEGMAISNKGGATDFLYIDGGQRYRFYRMSWIWGNGTNRFSRSVIYCANPSWGYSTVSSCQFAAQAPVFLYVDGTGSTNGLTPFVFDDRCIFESALGYPTDIVYIKDCTADGVLFENCTFNQQGSELRIFTNIDTPRPFPAIQSFVFHDCEWDYSVGSSALDRMMQLENVANIIMTGNHFQCGGVPSAAINLTNCRVTEFNGNYIRAVTTFFEADANTFITAGHNDVEISSMGRLISDAAKGYVDITWASPNTFFGLQDGDPGRNCVYRIDVPTAGTAWQIGFRNGSQGFCVPGQVFTLLIRNTSGGVITAPTFSSSINVSGAFTVPANGNSRSITFLFDGTNHVELYRSSADVPN
jgi:hypothetical protein